MLEIKQKEKQKLAKEEQNLIMKLSPIYLERLAEKEQIGMQRGRQEGIQQGRQQGRQEGIQQEAVSFALRMLNRKLGNLSLTLETRIKSLSLEKLEDLGEALLDFNSNEDLISWLENN
jgi:predicted transposase YdaD